jgi:hypothetical protein
MSNSHSPQHILDCSTLKATELRKRYKGEATSHRNMLQRAKPHGRTIHPSFRAFRDFLAYIGPQPCHGATLDRIDNSDPEYGPGKVRWADKRTQNSNKGDTLVFYYSRTRDTYTVSRLAKLRKVKPSTIRKRKERGWTDDEIIEGKREVAPTEVSKPTTSATAISARSNGSRRFGSQTNSSKSARQVQWERNAAYAAGYREEFGEEPCLADIETLREVASTVGQTIDQEGYDRKFAKDWAEMKPHVILDKLPEWARKKIASIEAIGATGPKQPPDP